MSDDLVSRYGLGFEPVRKAAEAAVLGMASRELLEVGRVDLVSEALAQADRARSMMTGRDRVLEAITGAGATNLFSAVGQAQASMDNYVRKQAEAGRQRAALLGAGGLFGNHDLYVLRTSGMMASEAARLTAVADQARAAQALVLPSALEAYRTSSDLLSLKLLSLDSFAGASTAANLGVFAQTSAMADLIGKSLRVDRDLLAASRAFALESLPQLNTLADHRRFLDAAGLILPRWPRLRLLTAAERRRRWRDRLESNAEPPAVKRAKSLVHRYESVLREIIDDAMADAYGEDWPALRLPRCECKDLLGKWRMRGGNPLDHADYAQYARIMTYPEHFAEVFEAGFDDPAALGELLKKAGQLRAASHHAGVFTPDDLRALRLTWRTLETGLLAFTPDHDIEAT